MLFLFLGSVRAALLTAVTIPLSLLFAFVCMHFTDIPANLLSLGALDFGIIVDGTLVMVEHIVHRLPHREQNKRRRRCSNAIREAALEVERPIFFSLIIIICGLPPAVHAGARRAAAVHADGLHGLLRAARIDAAGAHADPRACDVPVPQGAKTWDNPAVEVAAGAVRPPARSCAAPAVGQRWRVAAAIVLGAFGLGALLGPSSSRSWTRASSGSARIFPRAFRWTSPLSWLRVSEPCCESWPEVKIGELANAAVTTRERILTGQIATRSSLP